jgi:hypothetical protein
VTDQGILADKSFNWLAYQGLPRAESELDVVGTVYTSTRSADYAPNLQQCVDDGDDFCLSAGFLTADAKRSYRRRFGCRWEEDQYRSGERVNRSLRAHVLGLGRRVERLARSVKGLRGRLALAIGYHNLCPPLLSLREELSRPIPTKGNGPPENGRKEHPRWPLVSLTTGG